MTLWRRGVPVWWRDDDAGRYHPALDHLLGLASGQGVPLGLAIVPAWLDQRSIEAVLAARDIDVLQHGWAHRDHAPPGQKAIELGGTRATAQCHSDLRQGRAVLDRAFGDRFLPVLVPPWNRIDERVTAGLAGLDYRMLSTFADDMEGPTYGLRQINTHLDVIDWRRTREMKPLRVLIDELEALVARPETVVIGLLTHHLLMGDAEFDRLSRFLSHVAQHPSLEWTSPRAICPPD